MRFQTAKLNMEPIFQYTRFQVAACCLLAACCLSAVSDVKSVVDTYFPITLGAKANLLQSSGFKIRARMDIWRGENQPELAGQVDFQETYSVANERSLLEVRKSDEHRFAYRRYHVSGKSEQVVLVDAAGKNCTTVTRKDLMGDIFSFFPVKLREELTESWLQPIEGVPQYMLGVARILQYIDQNRDKLNMTFIQIVRDRTAHRYTMDTPFGSLAVSISDSTFNSWNGAELPLRVWLKAYAHTGQGIMIDFYQVEPLVSLSPLEKAQYYLDPTTVKLGLKCSAPATQDLLMPFREVYSMRADVIDVVDDSVPVRRYFLAYDGKQSAFRRDVLHEDGSPSTVTIYDFQRQLKFNIKHPSAQQELDRPTAVSADLGDSIRAKAPELDCVAGVSSGERASMFSIPYSELVLMGSGVVRGIEVDIYEHYNFAEPHLFFPPASFTNQTGKWQLLKDTLDAMSSRFGQHYSAIYYFARAAHRDPLAQAKGAGKLLYEIFDKLVRVDLMMFGHLLKKVYVYDFAWQLADAAGADRQEAIFSVPSACYRDAAWSSESALKISPQTSMRAQLDFVDATQRAITEEAAMALLDSPLVRWKALARGLSSLSPELSASRFLDVSSSLTKVENQRFQMHVNVKLSLAEGAAWQPSWTGTYVQLHPRRAPVRGPTNFDECFFEAVRRRVRDEVLFAFIHNACYIDEAPIYEFKPANETGARELDMTYSGVFRIKRSLPGPHLAMRVELVPGQGQQGAVEFQKTIYDSLMGKHIILPVVDTSHPEWLGESIIFTVSKLEFATLRHDQHADDPAASLNGLRLMSGHEVEKSPDGAEMTFEICRAVCQMDLACRSYSVCTRGLESTCRTSELDFGDPSLMRDLRPKLKEAREQRGGAQVNFSYEPHGGPNNTELAQLDEREAEQEEQQEPVPTAKQVRLSLDKRCGIFKKRALDMFLELPRSGAILKRKIVLQVDSEEECAMHCLDNNVKFFSRLPNAGLRKGLKKKSSEEIRMAHIKRMTKWCAMFKYLNLVGSSEGRKLREQLPEQKRDAICILSKTRGSSMLVGTGEVEIKAKAKMDTFEFAHINLFEAHHNIRMAHDKHLERKLAEMSSPEECARACFTQSVQLEPWCKSFEFVEIKIEASATSEQRGEGSHRTTTICAFNSMSLHDARQAGLYDRLVSTSSEPTVRVTFYEPRQAYMLNDAIMRLIGSAQEPTRRTLTQPSGPGFLLVFLVALVSGVALGIWMKQPLLEYWSNRHKGDLIGRRRLSNSASAEQGENI